MSKLSLSLSTIAFLMVSCFRVSNFEAEAMILRSVAYDLTCFMKVFDLGKTCSVFVNILPQLIVFSKGGGRSSGA